MKYKSLFFLLIFISFFNSVFSLDQISKDILKYGLDSEIINLVSNLEEHDALEFKQELIQLFQKTRNVDIKISILTLFSKFNYDDLTEVVLELLEDPFEQKKQIVNTALQYVSDLKILKANEKVKFLIESNNKDYLHKSIQVLGKIGTDSDAIFLLEKLDDDFDVEEKEALVLRQTIINSIGAIGGIETYEALKQIALDENENTYIRTIALSSIGKIKNKNDIPIFISFFEDSDPLLRVAAIKGISQFNTKEADDLIFDAFRDSHYKVRLEALDIVTEYKKDTYVPFIIYRAKNDPEDIVKNKSLEILGLFTSNDEAKSFLLEIFLDQKRNDPFRVKAASALLLNNFDFVYKDFEDVFNSIVHDDKKINFRNELAKLVAKIENKKSLDIARSLLAHKDPVAISLGLDMYKLNRYVELKNEVEVLATDEKKGAIAKRAKQILEN